VPARDVVRAVSDLLELFEGLSTAAYHVDPCWAHSGARQARNPVSDLPRLSSRGLVSAELAIRLTGVPYRHTRCAARGAGGV
jgi:hypothetical protein